MLKLDNVSSSYGESRVIKNVSLEISSGKFFAILGKNGMGKTTLLKTIMGLMDKSVEMDFGKPCGNCPGTTPCFV